MIKLNQFENIFNQFLAESRCDYCSNITLSKMRKEKGIWTTPKRHPIELEIGIGHVLVTCRLTLRY